MSAAIRRDLIALTYTSQCFRKQDVHCSLNLPELSHADAPIDDRIAVRANRYQVAQILCNGFVFRSVARRKLRGGAADAVDFPRQKRSVCFLPNASEECDKVAAKDQPRALVIAGW